MPMNTIVFCMPGFSFSSRALVSWTQLLLSCNQNQINPIHINATSPNIYHVRNYCLEGDKFGPTTQKPFGENIDYNYIMWIDSDVIYEPSHFYALYHYLESHPKIHILSGIYLTEDKKHYPVHIKGERLKKSHLKNKTKPLKVDSTGFGFTLIRKGVFESLSYPWFQPYKLIDTDKNYEMYLGEDVSFSYRAREKGFNTYIHPKVKVGHEKLLVIS